MGGWFLIRFVALAGILAAVAVDSCGSPRGEDRLDSEPDFAGFVTGIDRGGTGEVIGRITVESHAHKLVHRYVVTLTKRTVLLRREGQTTRPVDIGALELKNWVKVWFSGPAKESFPVKVTARQLMIVDRL